MKTLKSLSILIFGSSLLTSVNAQTVDFTLSTSDGSGESSFNSAINWNPSDGDPTSPANAGASYGVFDGRTLRAPTGSQTFGGAENSDSVTLYLGNGSTRGNFQNGISNNSTSTINNLIMNNGRVLISNNSSIAGTVTLVGLNNEFNGGAVGRTLTVASSIQGEGGVSITTTTSSAGTTTVVFSGEGNTYSGGTSIIGRNATGLVKLDVQSANALGTGDVTLNSFARLTLGTGTDTSNFISDSANLILQSDLAAGAVELNFIGANNIAGISFDGGTTFGAIGTYGAIGSGATFESDLFSGTGTLEVIPEPSSVATMAGILMLAIAFIKGRR